MSVRLTPNQLDQVMDLRHRHRMSVADIGRRFGVSNAMVSRITRGYPDSPQEHQLAFRDYFVKRGLAVPRYENHETVLYARNREAPTFRSPSTMSSRTVRKSPGKPVVKRSKRKGADVAQAQERASVALTGFINAMTELIRATARLLEALFNAK